MIDTRDYSEAYWKKGDKVVADFTRQFDSEYIPYPCWMVGIRTGHIGTVTRTRRTRLGRVTYTVDFEFTSQVMDLERLKNPGEPYRYPPGIGKFSGGLYNRSNRARGIAPREVLANYEKEKLEDTAGQPMSGPVNHEYQAESTEPNHASPTLPPPPLADVHEYQVEPTQSSYATHGRPIILGDTIRIQDVGTGEYYSYTIVNPEEIDPGKGRISYNSPIGRALLGREVGNEIFVKIPRGDRHYIIDRLE